MCEVFIASVFVVHVSRTGQVHDEGSHNNSN